MIYADTDFFLALLQDGDWRKANATKILDRYKGQITTSVITFVELGLLAKRYNLDVLKIFASVMAICEIDDERLLKAATYIRDYGLGVFDAFHAAYCDEKIISSDSAYERVGIERIKLEEG